jgi:hypothetical protein
MARRIEASFMDIDTLAACLRTEAGIAAVTAALVREWHGQPMADFLPALAATLLQPGHPMPAAPPLEPIDQLYYDAFPTLLALVDWQGLRVVPERARRSLISPTAHDALAAMEPIHGWGAITQLCHAALAAIRPRKRAAVVVTMRDDGISMLEWVAHYQAIGFDGIFIYSNDNADRSDALLVALADLGQVVFIENRTSGAVSPQHKAFAHSLHFLPELRDYAWVFYADSDEFLIPGPEFDHNIVHVLDAIESRPGPLASAVCYSWRWYLSHYAFAREDRPLLERFVHAHPHPLVKSLVRIGNVLSMRILHFPEVVENTAFLDAALNPIPGTEGRDKGAVWQHQPGTYQGGQISHFWCKSFEEFLVKKRRGDLVLQNQHNDYKRDLRLFFDWNGPYAPEHMAPPPEVVLSRMKARLALLREHPALRQAEALANEGFRELIASIGDEATLRSIYRETAEAASVSDLPG